MVKPTEIETTRCVDTTINVVAESLSVILGNSVATGKEGSSYTEEDLRILVAGKLTSKLKKDS